MLTIDKGLTTRNLPNRNNDTEALPKALVSTQLGLI